ncbi:putative arsenic resistance protein [Neofusicoccum parvum UCRNP2]|uniref:Putative arsenic resistance protein n=1 Tax=Botryosphaeria parva (strain UCR-NP2) TaxID=1287680 RepID=R1FWH1_BOTPV|nr:putative arsenic resistance protein [Neofusicoccum parvum UCRNP2]
MATENKAPEGSSAEVPWYAAYPEPRTEGLRRITREELLDRMKRGEKSGKDFVLVDVRRTDFEGGTIAGAINLPAHSLYSTIATHYAIFKAAKIPEVIWWCEALRETASIQPQLQYLDRSLAIPAAEDDAEIRKRYRPFLLDEKTASSDWISKLEITTAMKMVDDELKRTGGDRLKILVLHGSLRSRSYSRLLAHEASRILSRLGCDVRAYDPAGLPIKDDVQHDHPKVQELRALSRWSDGHVWVCPEQHGNLTAVFKNQIDWIPLGTGSVRPTQGRTLAVAQVSGGSQSFNTVNALRVLGRWMRMFAIPNQSSVPKAYAQFADAAGGSRMLPGANRERLVDCMEELVKYTLVMRPHFSLFGDRFSERAEGRREAAVVGGVDTGSI